jgi:hypothetical protein
MALKLVKGRKGEEGKRENQRILGAVLKEAKQRLKKFFDYASMVAAEAEEQEFLPGPDCIRPYLIRRLVCGLLKGKMKTNVERHLAACKFCANTKRIAREIDWNESRAFSLDMNAANIVFLAAVVKFYDPGQNDKGYHYWEGLLLEEARNLYAEWGLEKKK